jgi:hypothetical protein
MEDREEEMCGLPMVAAILASTVLAFTSSSAAETKNHFDLNSLWNWLKKETTAFTCTRRIRKVTLNKKCLAKPGFQTDQLVKTKEVGSLESRRPKMPLQFKQNF